MIREFELTCPECEGWILIDLETGEVLKHGKKGQTAEEAKKPKALDDAFKRFQEKQGRTDSALDDAMKAVERQKKRLEQSFEEAKKKAAKNPDEKPRRPFDDLFD